MNRLASKRVKRAKDPTHRQRGIAHAFRTREMHSAMTTIIVRPLVQLVADAPELGRNFCPCGTTAWHRQTMPQQSAAVDRSQRFDARDSTSAAMVSRSRSLSDAIPRSMRRCTPVRALATAETVGSDQPNTLWMRATTRD
jgi:hypothetical protein